MSERSFNDRHGSLTNGTVLRMQRRLPGPIERVWSYLTDSELRRQWLASGVMDARPGTSFELVWRNDELSASAAERPAGFAAEARATCRMEEVEAPRRMRFVWPNVGEVTFELEPVGNDVLLTLTHRRLEGEQLVLDVCAGWHAHFGRLVAVLEGKAPPSLWSTWKKLRAEYQELLADGVKR